VVIAAKKSLYFSIKNPAYHNDLQQCSLVLSLTNDETGQPDILPHISSFTLLKTPTRRGTVIV